jgi:hypothetical protein
MSVRKRISPLFCCLFLVQFAQAQTSTLRVKTIVVSNDNLQLDTLSIYPNSFQLFNNNELVNFESYTLNHAKGELILHQHIDTIRVSYRVLPMNLSKVYGARDTNSIYSKEKGEREKFLQTNTYDVNDVFGGTSISKSGSISRGVTFGNNQDLGVNSTLNLELSGDIAPNLKILASVSDDNLPIQPDGNTNKLQEFDQVFIQIYNCLL